MISRVAECSYWLQRYMERAESLARVLLVTTGGGLDGAVPLEMRWAPLLIVAGEYPSFVERFGEGATRDQSRVLEYLTWDTDCGVSIVTCLRAARENARVTRETISRETWETINGLWLWLESPASRAAWEVDPAGFFRTVRDGGHQFRGAVLATMPDDEALWFMNLGMYIERANQTARMLDVRHHALGPTRFDKLDSAADMVTWVQVLLASGAYESFFKSHHGTVRGYRVARFLLFDAALPRSVSYCLQRVHDTLTLIQGRDNEPRQLHSFDALHRLRAPLNDRAIEDIIEHGIHEELTFIVDGLATLGSTLYTDFFAPPTEALTPGPESSQSQS